MHHNFSANRLAEPPLRSGRADSATARRFSCAVGVSVLLSPRSWPPRQAAGLLGATGRCRVFDTTASGAVPGEGTAAAVLWRTLAKRGSVASCIACRKADEEQEGFLEGTAMQHVGRAASLTAPSCPGEQELVCEALRSAAVAPSSLDSVELHGWCHVLDDGVGVVAAARALEAGSRGSARKSRLLLALVVLALTVLVMAMSLQSPTIMAAIAGDFDQQVRKPRKKPPWNTGHYYDENDVVGRVRTVVRSAKIRQQLLAEGKEPGINLKRDRDQEVKFWRSVFDKYDVDSSGALDFEEITDVVREDLKISERTLSRVELRDFYSHLDLNGDMVVDWHEWLDFVSQGKLRDTRPIDQALLA
eukprot:s3201_g6.t1